MVKTYKVELDQMKALIDARAFLAQFLLRHSLNMIDDEFLGNAEIASNSGYQAIIAVASANGEK